jgi:hypothetical protein
MKTMTWTCISALLIALPLRAEPPAGPAPKLAIAFVEKNGDIVIEDVVVEVVMVPQTRTVTVNGVNRTETVNVPVQKTITQRRAVEGKKVAAYDMDGRQITPGRLASLLRERKAVAISNSGNKLPAAYRAALRDDVVVLVVPPPPEPIPAPAP